MAFISFINIPGAVISANGRHDICVSIGITDTFVRTSVRGRIHPLGLCAS